MKQAYVGSTGASRGSLRTYIAGFILSIVLTVIPFGLVMTGEVSRKAMLLCICGAGVLQILVHLHFFLHLDFSSAQRWNVLALLFAFLIMAIFIGGTLWVMYTLNYRMM
jgi:cytochrome o ubiquinol oxidase operon protein cyoD